MHSVGIPVGGTVRPNPEQVDVLNRIVTDLDSPWASEHLSFNSTGDFHTGFFLPPRQTAAGITAAVESVSLLRQGLRVPLAIETGVNYLRPRPDELSDGSFFSAVATKADCGILLDLHNVYTNAVNGRQALDDFLEEIPLDRVWEVHLAGGFEMKGFWLDAHSGPIPEPLLETSKNVIPRLPNLRAITFEVFPSFIPGLGIKAIQKEMEKLKELWQLRETQRPAKLVVRRFHSFSESPGSPTPVEWELALGSLVIGGSSNDDLSRQLSEDPAVGLLRELVGEFRASMIVSVLRLTSRLMMLALGANAFRTILEDFWSQTPPQKYASSEANAFANYLVQLDLKVPQLRHVLAFERAALDTVMDGRPQVVEFDLDPFPMLRALAQGRLPEVESQIGKFEIEITPEDVSTAGHEESTDMAHVRFH